MLFAITVYTNKRKTVIKIITSLPALEIFSCLCDNYKSINIFDIEIEKRNYEGFGFSV